MTDDNTQVKQKKGVGLAARRLAVEILMKVEAEGAYANLALASAFKRKSLSERDRAFVTALVQGVLRHRLRIDGLLGKLSSRPLEKMPSFLRNALRLAVFQLDQMDDIPASAVVDTCAELVRKAGHEGQVRFANGLLRSYLRNRETPAPTEVVPPGVEELPVSYSMPMWLVDKWLNQWGIDETRKLLAHAQKIPDLIIRTCEQAITAEGLENAMQSRGVKVSRCKLVDTCFVVADPGPYRGSPSKLPGYDDGLFTVQDEAAAFISKVVDPAPGDLVVDLCAAPGGKSIHMAELMQNRGRVIAVDSHAARLALLRKNRQRLGITNIETFVADARSFIVDTTADRVLLDVPCTGTGVMNRRSDIRFHREPPDLASLTQLQRQLLEHAATLVKPGGILVYSTCSIEPEENEDNICWFLEHHKEFRTLSLRPFVPAGVLAEWPGDACNNSLDLDRGFFTLMPSRHGTSGFFVCRMTRIADPAATNVAAVEELRREEQIKPDDELTQASGRCRDDIAGGAASFPENG